MNENQKLVTKDMDSDGLLSTGEFGENQKISIVDHVNGLQHSSTESGSFVVDMERLSHFVEKDANSVNPRFMLQRNLSRKGPTRSAERNMANNERDISTRATSPRATFHGGSTPEKPVVVALGPHDHSITPQVHHQITITNGSISSTAAAESKSGGKRFGFRRPSPVWFLDPRRILFFFATLSCMGTILLIYFTLSMGQMNGEEKTSS